MNNRIDELSVVRSNDRQEMGKVAANAVAETVKRLQANQDTVNIVFAAAPSQNEFLENLVDSSGINWNRVNAFHMDEYLGLPANAPQRFGFFLKQRLFAKLPFRAVNYLNGDTIDPLAECQRYADLLTQYPIDIVCMGIGENCHIAFNDPHVADFEDPMRVKVVDLDLACRNQQVHDGCFSDIEDVPTHALTLTVPALMAAANIFCIVPGPTKAQAVYHTLTAEVASAYPSTALRRHPNAILFLDGDSAALVA
ncbi:glucosamine-6-phosphate deaminase [Parapedobacter sp. ISTM3]|uniref:glucosamine-6-phosphate deaminase n=1 Tax=Parapedobacter sp. ISTM3 TaxID=2800130 RepID=UPI001905C9D4|nr:glucosamine-6-phosphate deaminase [Parapedobacter sp. ISTM3]MBK1440885.1 glucosamine-6-phosphate deaminase [Parapedobacter sp. ISTM3]